MPTSVREPALQVYAAAGSVWELAHAWALSLQGRGSGIFQTWEWIRAWLDLFARAAEPALLVVRDRNGAIIGQAPVFHEERRYGPIRLKTLRLIGSGLGAEHLIVLGAAGPEEASPHWLGGDRGWDVLELGWMAKDQAELLGREVARERQRFHLLPTEATSAPLLHLPPSWEVYQQTLSPSFRSGLSRSRRRLERDHGPLVIRRVLSDEEFERDWRVLVRLHQDRWQARGRAGAFTHSGFEEFHRRFGRAALERSWLRFYVLEAQGEALAALYCFHYGNRVSYFQGGFDLRWAPYGPGRLLMAHAIRTAIEEGATEFDFLRGTERHKLHWKPALRHDRHLVLFRKDPRVALPVLWRQRLRAAREWMRRSA